MAINFGEFLEREWLYVEAAGVNAFASYLSKNAAKYGPDVAAAAQSGVQGLVALIDKDASATPEGIFVAGALNTVAPTLEADLAALVAKGEADVPNVVAALQNAASALQAKANAL